VLLALSAAAPARAATKVTLESLLQQMTDLSRLAEYPDPPFVAKQFSSYDRRSESPKDQGANAWYANDDHGFMLYDGVLKEETAFHLGKPMPDKPSGFFKAGTKVGIAPNRKPVDDYVWVYSTAPDGGPIAGKIPQGYVAKSAITMDPQGHVLADMDGPGCVTRIWSANPDGAGRIKIYLDGEKEPVIDASMQQLLGGYWKTRKPSEPGASATGDWIPFPDPIACERSRGYNLYFPITYAKHCKITIERPDIYYHVDYRTYPKGTEVETFRLNRLNDIQERAEKRAKDGLKEVLKIGFPNEDNHLALTLAPGKSLELSFKNPGAIRSLQVSVTDFPEEGAEPNEPAAMRGLVLIGRFDDPETPQIWCPLGDFFGSSPGVNEYRSLPFTVARDAKSKDEPKTVLFSADWPMPFQKSAVFEIRNLGQERAYVDLRGISVKYPWTDRSMHFHAKWRTEKLKTRPFRDWTYCDIKGKGVFVGDMLSLCNPVTAWWGEGDEKIYVDGEKFPSWFGTGSEDYYGYAWSDPKPFQHAYHNQTRCDGPGTKGHTSVNRFHILDCIPFEKSFKFDMEIWHWTPDITIPYAATSYWYARPGATDDFKEVDAKVLQEIPSVPPPYKIEGAIEAEKMKVAGTSGKFDIGPQDMSEFPGKWSGDSHLWIRPDKAGSWVDLELPVAEGGEYKVIAYLTKARDYGIVQFSLDGKKIGKEIDCFEPEKVVAMGAIELGTVELKKGKAMLRLELVGTNEKSVGLKYMAGLDCVVLKKK
jgi:D-arabinan exo alpha-(1,3)/(1,5)-arabinofuranosidase (non-reducing end)